MANKEEPKKQTKKRQMRGMREHVEFNTVRYIRVLTLTKVNCLLCEIQRRPDTLTRLLLRFRLYTHREF